MRIEADGMSLVRAELCERLAGLEGGWRRGFAEDVAQIRCLAAAYGLIPVVRVAAALERAVAEDRSACPRALYLARLKDAIGCERMEESASEALLASVSVRLCA